MAISIVTLADSFLTWLNKTNEVIAVVNKATEGQLNSTGTLTLTNASGVGGGITLNVHSGLIKGDGGLLSNVGAPGSIVNAKLANNFVRLISNSATLTISGGQNANLGATVYFNVGTLSNSIFDASSSNIASANSVNTSHSILLAADAAINGRLTSSYDAGNTTQALAVQAYSKANIALSNAQNAHATANGANVTAIAAFNKANTAGGGYFKGNQGTVGAAVNANDIFRVHVKFVGSNVFIEGSENAMGAGPLTVNTGRFIQVNSGGRLVIV
jgi:hypothetical protein